MHIDIFIEIFGAVTGLLFVYLEIKQRREMWIIEAISALTYIVVFLNSGLIAAMGLQFYYLGASMYGWKQWGGQNREESDGKLTVSKLSGKTFAISAVASGVVYIFLAFILDEYSKDPMPKVDTLIAVISMLATYWVTKKYIENWILWIVADALSVYLCISQELYATTILYFIYLIAAVIGYMHWRKFSKL
ncbi:MAG: nicotinamide riboside transporter PnuC [Rikenellaceae bacterium]